MNDINLLHIIKSVASELDDFLIKKAENNFSNEVFIGEKYIYKVTVADYKLEKGDHLKEAKVFKILNTFLNEKWNIVVPNLISKKLINDKTYLQVHSKLKGQHPTYLSNLTVKNLAIFLSELHKINHFKGIDEFEDNHQNAVPFSHYVEKSTLKYHDKLKKNVDNNDLKLIQSAIKFIEKSNTSALNSLELVLVHKDIYKENILVSNNDLSGVIDWEASQIAPKEWELAIIMQRYPEHWDFFLNNYSHKFDFNILKLCGLVQSLRFWKSFPTHTKFVEDQKEFIKKLLFIND